MKPDIKIKLDGKEYRLRMNLKAMINIEDELGVPITRITNDVGVKQICVFVKHSIRDTDGKRISAETWDEMTDEIGVDEIFDAFGKIMDADKGKKGAGGKNRK